MTDPAWIDAALSTARPQAVGALLRYFRDLDLAEEAFQEACLRALKAWPKNGPPRDPTAWLIFVGRNAALDSVRKLSRHQELPPEDQISDLEDVEEEAVDRLDRDDYRDDVLRLLFICCHPDLPATQQVALALRIVSGLSVRQIARAFLISEAAMEQRITRAKRLIGQSGAEFQTPSVAERAQRLTAVLAMLYLIFNEGYSAAGEGSEGRAVFADEAIRLGRLLLRLFPAEPEVMGLMALMLLQHSRTPARFDDDGQVVLLEEQDRRRWNRSMITEGLAMIDRAVQRRQTGPYQVQAAIAALHARADRAEDTDWGGIEKLYATLEQMTPSPVVTLNRAVATSKIEGAAHALEMIEPLSERLAGYFYFHGMRGGLLLQLGRKADARTAFDRAISLANTAAEAAHIRQQIDRLTAVAEEAHRL
jgi:RNA polymerase sigma-70 factor, ECF subfamily